MAQGYLETRLLLQECKESHFPGRGEESYFIGLGEECYLLGTGEESNFPRLREESHFPGVAEKSFFPGMGEKNYVLSRYGGRKLLSVTEEESPFLDTRKRVTFQV